MNFNEYVEKKKEIYQNILEYLDNEDDSESNFEHLNEIFINQSIQEKKEDIDSIFRLLISISNNHHRSQDFFSKIERILTIFKPQISQFFTNNEIFSIFRSNKRILLFLIEEKILNLDESIAFTISNGWYKRAKYHFYFYPEIKNFLSEKQLEKMTEKTGDMNDINSDDFESNRKRGENDKYVCKLIQNDEIDDFIVYVNKTNFSLSNTIKPSIFETNYYLLNKETNLIDYAAFYGSIQIFRYLYINKVNFSPFLWNYAIHCRKPEIIHLLEEYQIKPIDATFSECLNESIKCHHNEIANYLIQNNLIENCENGKSVSIKYYNFEYFPTKEIDSISFYFACKYNNIFIVKNFLEKNSKNFDINTIFTEGNIQQTVLTAATKEKNKDIVELLLSVPSIDVNFKSVLLITDLEDETRSSYKKEKNSLHIAVEQNDEEIVKLLLKNTNIDVNDQMMYYDTCSCVTGHVEKTALNIAIEKGNTKIVEILLQHPKIDVNKISKHNDSSYGYEQGHDRFIEKIALILAVERENLEIISLLLNHPKIDVNRVDEKKTGRSVWSNIIILCFILCS